MLVRVGDLDHLPENFQSRLAEIVRLKPGRRVKQECPAGSARGVLSERALLAV
jgi:hypothetical protein